MTSDPDRGDTPDADGPESDADPDPETVRADWADRDGEFSPRYYAGKGPDHTSEALFDALSFYVGTDARVLELGCGSGRHLEYLRRSGFSALAGVDINDESFEVMEEFYPALAETGEFHVGPIEEFLPELPEDAFDAVYSVETLQHVHPEDAWVFAEVVRVAEELVVTVENEGNSADTGVRTEDGGPDDGGSVAVDVSYVNDEFPLYHRDWKAVFSALDTVQVVHEPGERDTLRAFRVV